MVGKGTRAVPDGQAERQAELSMNGETSNAGDRRAEFPLAGERSVIDNGPP